MRRVHRKTRTCALLLLGIFVLGTTGFMVTERLSPIDAAYSSVVTISTVGFGDIAPVTAGGKLVAVLFILSGVASFMALIASATEDLLNSRDRRVRAEKCHMLAGLFFSEVGDELMREIFPEAPGEPPPPGLADTDAWTSEHLAEAGNWLHRREAEVGAASVDLDGVRAFLDQQTTLLLRLLENPALLENQAFTDLLRAVFHLRQELAHRDSLTDLPAADAAHIGGDLRRVYTLIVPEWVAHMEYLRVHYPYLYSLAVRTNPVDGRGTAAVH